MKKFMVILGIIAMVFIAPLILFAQTAPTDAEVITDLFALIGGWKALGSFVAALGITQLLTKLFKSPMGLKILEKIPDKYEFLFIQGLALVSAYLTLLVSGVTGVEALVKTVALPIFVEYLYKIYKLFVKKEE